MRGVPRARGDGEDRFEPADVDLVELRGARPPDADERRGVADRVDAGGGCVRARVRSRMSPSTARPGRDADGRVPREDDRVVPGRASARTIALPRYPVPPVTRTCIRLRFSAIGPTIRDVICCRGCSSGRQPGPWCARRADRSSVSTTTSATPAAAGIPGSGDSRPLLRRLGNDFGFLPLVLYGCIGTLHAEPAAHAEDGGNIMGRGPVLHAVARAVSRRCAWALSGADPVFRLGMWWTVLSAGWLHGSALHILFNMMVVRQIGPVTADIYGGVANGDHLRRVVRLRFSPELGRRRRSCRRLPIIGGAPLHARRVGADLRAARRA